MLESFPLQNGTIFVTRVQSDGEVAIPIYDFPLVDFSTEDRSSRLLNDYYKSLEQVKRFQDPDLKKVNTNFTESAWKHTVQVVDLGNRLISECPQLTKYLQQSDCAPDLFIMLFMHEAGEPLGGDMPKTMEDYRDLEGTRMAEFLNTFRPKDKFPNFSAEDQRKLLKNRENRIVRLIISKFIPEDLRDKAIQLYMRFENSESNDLLAQIAVLLDVLDGARTFFKQYAPNLVNVLGRDKAESKIRASQGFISEQFSRVAALLPEPVQLELKEFMNNMAEQAVITKYFPQV